LTSITGGLIRVFLDSLVVGLDELARLQKLFLHGANRGLLRDGHRGDGDFSHIIANLFDGLCLIRDQRCIGALPFAGDAITDFRSGKRVCDPFHFHQRANSQVELGARNRFQRFFFRDLVGDHLGTQHAG
jgi:hypothetical protein